MTTGVTERRDQVAGHEVFLREAQPAEGQLPTLYLHGVPTDGADWIPFLEKAGGVAPDLLGFGQSEKPRWFEYSIGAYNGWLQALVDKLGWDRFNIVVHDWGGLGLVTAQDLHERIGRVVIMNAVPLLPDYRWHRIARVWRTPVIGEVAMGLTTKSFFRAYTKPAQASGEPWPQDMLDHAWSHFDQGTQRAILKLYRSAPPAILEQAGERFSELTAETLVLWGEQDPYIPTSFAQAYADALPNSTVELLPDAGHWSWLDRPDVVDIATGFLSGAAASR